MNIKQPTEGKNVGWKYFPDTNTLVSYLDREDLIELSKSSKFYRKQLEKQVLGKLDLDYYKCNISEIYEGLYETHKVEKISELLKSDLGPKLKLVQSVYLDCETSRTFAEKFVKLLPNINTLRLDVFHGHDCVCDCEDDWQQGLMAASSCMDHLEHVNIEFEGTREKDISTKLQIFPKSLKSLNINLHKSYDINENENLYFYDTIDASYINLQSITIVSNTMLKNLSFGMLNLQKVDIIDFQNLDESNLINFLKTNSQLRKLNTDLFYYNVKIIRIVLSYENLEHWNIGSYCWKDTEINSLPSNYSIKHLRISYDVPAPVALKIINACKGLETLDLSCYIYHLDSLEWSKIKRRVNILKLSFDKCSPNDIEEIDSSRVFNSIYIERGNNLSKNVVKRSINQLNNIKLSNYKFIKLISKVCKLKLINKTN